MTPDIYADIKKLADQYAMKLKKQVDAREKEMADDDTSHYLLYRVLGITNDEGHLIDLYQNKGRFLYQYAGAFLEEAAVMCIKHKEGLIKSTRAIREAFFVTTRRDFAGIIGLLQEITTQLWRKRPAKRRRRI